MVVVMVRLVSCGGDGGSRGDGDDEWCILAMAMAGDERLVPTDVR
jgi:hypothetical protein